MNRIDFSEKPRDVQYAVIASFDMSGFSKFCHRPVTHGVINRYLANLFRFFDDSFKDFLRDIFKDTAKFTQAPRPDFVKYTGDGALLFWVRASADDFTNELCTSIVAALRHFQQELPKKVSEWEKQWRTTDLPRQARVGICIGPIHPLHEPEGTTVFGGNLVDYAGYPINLAVRLQDHCPEVGFLVHSPLHPQLDGLVELIALKMKGVMDEPVYAFKSDFIKAFDEAPKKIEAKFRLKAR